MTRERSIAGGRSKHVSMTRTFQTRRRLGIPRPVSGRAKHTDAGFNQPPRWGLPPHYLASESQHEPLELVRRCILEAMTFVAPGVFAASATQLLLFQIVYGQNLARVVREHREVLLGLLAQLEDG